MAIVGLGTDIIEIARLGEDTSRIEKLAKRVLTPAELQEFESSASPARLLAKRFAAKEAAVKALGTGIGRGISWQHFEIQHSEMGAPLLLLSGNAKQVADALGANSCWVSIADEQHYAVATVVLSA